MMKLAGSVFGVVLAPERGGCRALLPQVKALLQALKQHSGNSQPAGHQTQQQQQAPPSAQPLPWQQLCTMRRSLDLALLPRQLVCGSQYLPSADGINQNLLLLLHGLGDTPAAFAGA
jgi:hypothetical protein